MASGRRRGPEPSTPTGCLRRGTISRVSGRPSGFSYATSAAGEVMITHHGQATGRLRGAAAARFLAEAGRGDDQLLMARVTGQYKHGNERTARQHPRNRGR